ncbi:hypothetical protein Plo01_46480 [Planobispora longispora]|uniref:Carbohydrate-binding module family 96 domain-containing protein n=2 Tax=Planobispora longispora TaxID=28887 RepID=A0A8J3RRB0_9ACTN|nr:hypothetical protein Plo01_46480 [Planobispora longispora]
MGMATSVGSAAADPQPAASTEATATSAHDKNAAKKAAREHGRPVRVDALLAEQSTTWAMPDQTLKTELYAGPIRLQRGGAWRDIDTTLTQSDGVLKPKVAKAEVEISTGGTGPFLRLRHGNGNAFGVRWAKNLPTPTVEGDTATFADVIPGGDLVVTALSTGFTHDVVLRKRPTGPVEIRMPLELTGMKLDRKAAKGAKRGEGRLELTDTNGDLIGTAPDPQMWDAAAEDSPDAGQRAVVDTEIATERGQQVLVLRPDATFLNDPDVRYPVRIDPWTSLALTTDAFVSTDYPSPGNASTWLHAGKFGSGAKVARTYLKFDTTPLLGKAILNADLKLWSYKSNACGMVVGSGIQARRVTAAWTKVTLSAQPATTTEDAVTNRASYGAPNCKEEWLWWSIEGIVADWANGAANHGLQMRAANENDTTNWRMFHSAEFAGGNRPTLVVKYEDQGIVAPAGPDGVEVFRGNGEDVPQMSDTLSAALDKAIDAAEANPADLAQPYADAETGQLITPAVTTAGQTLAAKTLSGQAATGEGSDDPTVPGAVEASEEGDAAETPDTSAGTTVSYSIASAVANAKYSAGALQAIADEIAGLDATQLPGADAIYITGVQPERNRVVVQATSASVETRQALAARYGLDKVAIRLIDPGQVPVKTESRNNDIGDYIAGGAAASPCTTGFAWMDGTTPAMLGAGHCYDTNITDLGLVAYDTYGPNGTVKLQGQPKYRGDLALVYLTKYPRGGSASIWIGGATSTQRRYVSGVYRKYAKVGDRYCVSGKMTGETCGWKVVDIGETITYKDGDEAKYLVIGEKTSGKCIIGGDSGSPVYTIRPEDGRVVARGITSGGTALQEANFFLNCRHYFTDIRHAVNAMPGSIKRTTKTGIAQ